MNLAKKIGLAYIKGIDATIRFIGSYFIIGILFFMIHGLCVALSFLPLVSSDPKYMTGVLSLVLLPLIVRLGVLGGGLSIPPIFGEKKQDTSSR
jgi:hypothetical protein